MTLSPALCVADLRIPDDLVEHDQWVLWRYEERNGSRAKVPYQPNGSRASSTDRHTWVSFDIAVAALRRDSRSYVGLGFVFTIDDPFVGLDLDDCLDVHGVLKGWARGIVERFGDTYAEVSPSGMGIKIWARGALPANVPGARVADGAVEMYDRARYFAVTGRAFRGAPLEVEDHAADLLRLHAWLTRGKPSGPVRPQSDGVIRFGGQHNTLVSLCGALRARRICEDAIEACLQIVNAQQCERPGPRDHISQIVRSSRNWRSR